MDSPDHLERAAALTNRIRQSAAEIESLKRLPDDLVVELFDAGLFSMLLPSELGGAQLPAPEYLSVIEQIALGDSSTAWCVNQACVFSTLSTRLPLNIARDIWTEGPMSMVHGPPAATSAVPADGGYRVTGRWKFGSGIGHAKWLAGRCAVEGRQSEYMLVMFPRAKAEILPSWNVRGLVGTGSHDFAVEDLFVPAEHTLGTDEQSFNDNPLFLFPLNPLFASGFASVALGTAQAMYDLTIAIATRKRANLVSHRLDEDPHVHELIGLARAALVAARHYLHGELGSVWEEVASSGELTMDQRVRLRLSGTHCLREARRVCDILWDVTGTDGIFVGSELHRRYQDIQVITQQVQARTSHYPLVGRYTLGHTENMGAMV